MDPIMSKTENQLHAELAAMREALETYMALPTGFHSDPVRERATHELAQSALSSDAGRGYVRRDVLEQLGTAASKLRAAWMSHAMERAEYDPDGPHASKQAESVSEASCRIADAEAKLDAALSAARAELEKANT